MSSPRVTGLLVWVLGAAALGTVTWHAVGTVVEPPVSGDVVLGPAEVSQALASTSASPSASASPSPSPSASPSASASARPAAPPPPTPTGTDDPASAVVRSWSVTGGEVAAACRGETIELLSATPRDGWTVEVEDVEADWLAVEFHRPDQETQVAVRCIGGTPVIAARTSGSTPRADRQDDDPAGDD